ncbi:MAG: hypothetical protein IPK82_20545 [Polyangiaceae bacterium]|nr:hypothetical protein [Polyangiaceae bacterium]
MSVGSPCTHSKRQVRRFVWRMGRSSKLSGVRVSHPPSAKGSMKFAPRPHPLAVNSERSYCVMGQTAWSRFGLRHRLPHCLRWASTLPVLVAHAKALTCRLIQVVFVLRGGFRGFDSAESIVRTHRTNALGSASCTQLGNAYSQPNASGAFPISKALYLGSGA